MEEEKKKKVALYIRVSTDEQAEMYGVDLQKEALMGLIASKRQTLEFAGDEYVYIDEGVSGTYEPEERPAFRRLMEDISHSYSKPFDVVAVYKIDRFARRLKVLLEILDIFEKREDKIEFLSANESIDTSTPFGRAMLGIIGVIAELELENIKERTSSGRASAASHGVFMNVPPLGYVKIKDGDDKGKIQIQEEEKAIVELIFSLFVREGRNINQIARYLSEKKKMTPQAYRYAHKKEDQGKRGLSKAGPYAWDPTAIRNILTNELYIGTQYYDKTVDGKKVSKDKWKIYYHNQAIIDKDVFRKAQQYLSINTKRYKREKIDGRLYLLQGLLKCANCYNPTTNKDPYSWNGFPKRVKSTGEKVYYYQCSSKNSNKKERRLVECNTIPLPAIPLENHVINFLGQLLDNPKIVFKYQQELQSKKLDIQIKKNKLEMIKHLINTSEVAKERVLTMYQDGNIDKPTKDTKLKELNDQYCRNIKEMEEIESELSIFSNTKEYIKTFELFQIKYREALKDYHDGMDKEYLYSLIHMMIEEIIVFSRPKRKTDSISGPKKEGQMIPYKLKIVLKIPSEMLGDLLLSISSKDSDEDKFQAEIDEWWTTQDSNL
ncbi:MAG: recombinase family protein [Methanofastidiosum sp.]